MFALWVFVVVCHLESCPLESALNVEPLVRLAAIENALVATHLGRDEIESLDNLESELLALLVLRNGDIFDVAYETEVVDAGIGLANIHPQEREMEVHVQLPLDDQSAGSYYPALVLDNEDEISSVALCVHPVVSLIPLLLCYIPHRCEDAQTVKETTGVVAFL